MPPTRTSSQPWYTSLSIDIFTRLIANTLFHPFICWLIPLCMRAVVLPWDDTRMVAAIGWAGFMTVVSFFQMFMERHEYGLSREVDHEEEVIVITGGASGLGRCLAEVWAMKGASVAVLDKKGVDGDAVVEGVRYYNVDLRDRKAVEEAWGRINEELGLPTILINNAGVVHGKKLLDLSMDEVEDTFGANTIAQYHLAKLFLPPLLEREGGGTLVTLSSVLGHLGASRLSDYTASKAANRAFHQSLSAELRAYPDIKMILVSPGHLSSEMFASLEETSAIRRFFGPVVEVSELAMVIFKMVCEGRGGEIVLPFYARWIGIMDLVPRGFQRILRNAAGIDTSMDQFGANINGHTNGDAKKHE